MRIRCLVLVKIYGNSPKKLFVRIIRNRDVRLNEFPLFSFPFLRIVFISWCSVFINKLTTEWPKKMYTLFTHQYLWNKFK